MADAGWITTEGVAAELEPPADGRLYPSGKAMGRAGAALTGMQKAGYVRRAPGRLWGVGGAGADVIAAMTTRPAPKRYRTFAQHRRSSKRRRDVARDKQQCINENSRGTHGPATHGCRCFACHETHKRTA